MDFFENTKRDMINFKNFNEESPKSLDFTFTSFFPRGVIFLKARVQNELRKTETASDEFDRASTSNLRRQRHFEMRVSIHEFSFVT